jgi:hypothetical protein
MTRAAALARIEARHLARSPLLWLAFALAAVLAALEMSWFLPALPGDALFAYTSGGLLLSGGAVLAGAWLGRRDQTTGAAELVAVTPTAPWRLQRARLGSVAVVTAGVFTFGFATALAVSVVRGGRGAPDLRLLADGALAMVLGGWVGLAVGRLTGSRMVAVLAAPVWVVLCFLFMAGPSLRGISLSVQHLSPVLNPQNHSAAYGLLPDPLWPHLGYLFGLTVLVGALLLALASRGSSSQRVPLRSLVAAAVAGLVLVATAGARLLALPDDLLVLGPDRASWQPVHGESNPQAEALFADPGWSFPADDRARACAGDATVSVCVYPAYGRRLARDMHAAIAPVARLFAGLPGAPTLVRMVPVGMGSCRNAEAQVPEAWVREPAGRSDQDTRHFYLGFYLDCALGRHPADEHPVGDARAAVDLWALLAGGIITREQLQQPPGGEADPASFSEARATATALAMAELPSDRVRAELVPLWERLRAGILPLSELPGQRP